MFSIQCTNKGCYQIQTPYIDPKDDKVYCSLCEKEIINVTIFTKKQMKNAKQYRPKQSTSFSVKCDKCGKEARPKLLNNDVVCAGCNKSLDNLSVPFRNMLKDKLKKVDQDI
jgi:hypothetical protein